MARMLVALMEQPKLSTEQMQAAAGLGWRANCLVSVALLRRGFTERERWGRFFHQRLTRAAEDALLLVVVGVAE